MDDNRIIELLFERAEKHLMKCPISNADDPNSHWHLLNKSEGQPKPLLLSFPKVL